MAEPDAKQDDFDGAFPEEKAPQDFDTAFPEAKPSGFANWATGALHDMPMGPVLGPLKTAALSIAPKNADEWANYLDNAPTGRVISAFGDAFKGPGFTEAATDTLRKLGIYNDVTEKQNQTSDSYAQAIVRPIVNSMRAANELVTKPLIAGFDVLQRASEGVLGAIAQTGQEVEDGTGTALTVGGHPIGELFKDIAGAGEMLMTTGEIGPRVHTPLPENVARARSSAVIGEGEEGYFNTRQPTDAEVAARTAAEAQLPPEVKAAESPAAAAAEPTPATPAAPDIHQAARQISPETFTEYDALAQRKDTYRRWLDELSAQRDEKLATEGHPDTTALDEQIADLERKSDNAGARMQKRYAEQLEALDRQRADILERVSGQDTPDMAQVRKALQETDYRMRDLAPQVSAAYREAETRVPKAEPEPPAAAAEQPAPVEAEVAPKPQPATDAAPAEPVPAEPARAAEPATPEQIKNIAEDVTKKLTAAGRPEEEARAAAQVVAAYYDTRAQRFGGTLGSPEELYAREAPEIKTGRGSLRARERELAQTDKVTVYDANDQPIQADQHVIPGAEKSAELRAKQSKMRTGKPQQGAGGMFGGDGGDQGSLFQDAREFDQLSKAEIIAKMRRIKAYNDRARERALDSARRQKEFRDAMNAISEKMHADFRKIREDMDRDRAEWDRRWKTDPEFRRQKKAEADAYFDKERKDSETKARREYKPAGPGESSTAQPLDVLGAFPVDDNAMVLSDKGAPIKFGDQKAAARWILDHGNKESRGQTFEVANHPSGNGFTVWERERAGAEEAVREYDQAAQELEQPRRGKINILDDGRKTITLFRDADASTFMHETGHAWLEDLMADAGRDEAPADLKADAATVRKWLGAEEGQPIARAQHEKWARGFERYLMEGRAPSKALADVFAKFRDWLTKIYQTVKALRSPINDDIRDVFDRLLAKTPERVTITPEERSAPSLADIHEADAEHTPPAEAAPVADRVHVEAATKAREKRPEVVPELDIDPAAKAGARPAERANPDGGVAAPGPDAGTAGGLQEPGAVVPGRGEAAPQGGGLRSRPAGAKRSGLYARIPREPTRLVSFIKKLGGVAGRGDLKAILGTVKTRPGLINERSGRSLDDLALSAWENGYFPEHSERPSVDDLLRRMEDDLRGNPQYSESDAHEVADYQAKLAQNSEIDRIAHELGIDQRNLPQAEFWDKVAERMSEERRDREIEGRETAREGADAELDRYEPTAEENPPAEPGAGPADTGGSASPGPGEAAGEDREGQRRGGDQSASGNAAPESEGSARSPFGSSDADLVEKAGNIRLDLLRTPEDVNDVLRQFAKQNNEFAEQRFGDEGRALYNQVLGTRHLLKQAGDDYLAKAKAVSSLSEEEAAGTMDTEGVVTEHPALEEMRASGDRLAMIQGQLAVLTHQWGIAGHAFRDMWNLPSVGESRTLAQWAKRSRELSQSDLRREAALAGRFDTSAQRLGFLYQTRQSLYDRGRAMYIEYFVNNLISGPITHLAYTIGNAVNAVAKATLETPAAAAISVLRGAPAAERVYLGEAAAQMLSWGRGSLDGWDAAARAWREGQAELLPGEVQPGLFGDQGSALASRQGAIPGAAGKTVRLPSDAVQAIHSFGRRIGYTQEIYRLAYRDAAAKGLEGAARDQAMARFIANPPEVAMAKATNEATRMVLMSRAKYGTAFYALKQAVDKNVVAKTVAPFMQIGANLLHEAFMERTPLGALDSNIRANLSGANGAAARDIQLGKMAVGTALSGAVIYAALEGRVSGSGPTDPAERREMLSRGWQPYSVNVNGRWVPYRKYLGPFGLLFGAAANIGEATKAGADGDYGGVATSLVGGLSEVVADESWFRGVSNFVAAVRNWDKPEGERYLEDLATDFIPFSVGASQVARMVDPYAREAHTLSERALAKIPFASKTLLPRRDIFGDPVASKLTTTATKDRSDPSYRAMEGVGYFPAALSRSIRGVKLTDEQYDDYSRIAGRMAKMRLDALVHQQGWGQIPGHLQYKLIQDVFKHARETARSTLIAQSSGHPNDILMQAVKNKVDERAYRDE